MAGGIRRRLVVNYLAVIAVVVLVMGAFFIWFFNYYYMDILKAHLQNQARLATALFREVTARQAAPSELDSLCRTLGEELGLRVTLVARDGTVLGDSDELPDRMDNHFDRPEIQEAVRDGFGSATRYSATLGEEMFYVATPLPFSVTSAPGNSVGDDIIRLAVPLSRIKNTIGKLQLFVLAALALSFLAALFVGVGLSQRITGPLHAVSRAARSIAGGNYEPPLEVSGGDEISILARTVREMGLSLKSNIEQITLEKSKLDTVIGSMDSGILLVDQHMRVDLCNPAAKRLFQTGPGELAGKPVQEVMRHYPLYESLKAVVKEGRGRRLEINLYYPRHLVLQASLAPVKDDRGRTVGVLALFHDITSLRSLEKMRTDFVANVSHELRTPLTAIKGYAETILDRDLTQEQLADFLAIIDREAGRLARLVDSLLDLSRIEGEKTAIGKELLDLAELSRTVLQDLREAAVDKEISLNLDYDGGPLLVEGNREWLRQALVNVVDNAIKYGLPGGIIRVSPFVDRSSVTLEVIDDGPGIPASDLPHLFERFYRVDKARSRASGGSGLGLAIVKHILEAHGATYGIDSEEGQGTVFRFTMPLASSPTRQEETGDQ